jgi:hypothetical protein
VLAVVVVEEEEEEEKEEEEEEMRKFASVAVEMEEVFLPVVLPLENRQPQGH